MAFKIALSPTYTWEVAATVPVNGKRVESPFTATFKRLTGEQIKESQSKPLSEFCREILVGWGPDLADDNGPLPFTPENVDRLLSVAGMPALIVETYYLSIGQARAKN